MQELERIDSGVSRHDAESLDPEQHQDRPHRIEEHRRKNERAERRFGRDFLGGESDGEMSDEHVTSSASGEFRRFRTGE